MSKIIDPSEFNKRISIQSIDPNATTRNAYNEISVTWVDVLSRWAKIEAQKPTGLQLQQADTRVQLQAFEVTMRYTPLLNMNCRLTYNGVINYNGLTAAQYLALNTATYGSFNWGPPPIILTIQGINDVLMNREYLVVECCVVSA